MDWFRILATQPNFAQRRKGQKQAMLIATLEHVASMLDAENIEAAPVLHMGGINETFLVDDKT